MADQITDADLEELSQAVAVQYQIDYEQTGPKAPHGDITYKGVLLSSRYDVQGEYDHMRSVVDQMPDLLARRLESIFCDSNACAYFNVQIKPHLFVEMLPDAIEYAFRVRGGYNGLAIDCPGKNIPTYDPYWPGEGP